MGVTGSSQNFENAIINGEEGNVESTTTKIIDNDLRLSALLVKTVGDSGCGGFVDDTKNLETGDGACVLGSLTLGVVEVCRARQRLKLRITSVATYRQGR